METNSACSALWLCGHKRAPWGIIKGCNAKHNNTISLKYSVVPGLSGLRNVINLFMQSFNKLLLTIYTCYGIHGPFPAFMCPSVQPRGAPARAVSSRALPAPHPAAACYLATVLEYPGTAHLRPAAGGRAAATPYLYSDRRL